MTGEASQAPRLQMVSPTLTEDFSSLWALAWEAPQDSWLKGRLREKWSGLWMIWPEGQAKGSVGRFLLYFFSGINKLVAVPDIMDVLTRVTHEACHSSASSNRKCPAHSSSSTGSPGSLTGTEIPSPSLLCPAMGPSKTPDLRIPGLSRLRLSCGLAWKPLPNIAGPVRLYSLGLQSGTNGFSGLWQLGAECERVSGQWMCAGGLWREGLAAAGLCSRLFLSAPPPLAWWPGWVDRAPVPPWPW